MLLKRRQHWLREDVGDGVDVDVGVVLCELMGSHSVTCHPAEVTFPPARRSSHGSCPLAARTGKRQKLLSDQ